jgi:hypothetical protein
MSEDRTHWSHGRSVKTDIRVEVPEAERAGVQKAQRPWCPQLRRSQQRMKRWACRSTLGMQSLR